MLRGKIRKMGTRRGWHSERPSGNDRPSSTHNATGEFDLPTVAACRLRSSVPHHSLQTQAGARRTFGVLSARSEQEVLDLTNLLRLRMSGQAEHRLSDKWGTGAFTCDTFVRLELRQGLRLLGRARSP